MDAQFTIRTTVTDADGKVLSENTIYVEMKEELIFKNFVLPKTAPDTAKPVVANGTVDIEARNKKIMKMYEQGKTRREIATKLGLSYHTIYGITQKMAEES